MTWAHNFSIEMGKSERIVMNLTPMPFGYSARSASRRDIPRIAQLFSVGLDRGTEQVPKGRPIEPRTGAFSAVPSGLANSDTGYPTLKRWAIVACPSGTANCRLPQLSFRKALGLRHLLSQRAAFTVLPALFLSGCRGAPSINVLGSFFPGWMLCMGLGLLGALVFRQVFIKANVESHLVPRPLVYLCLWGLVTLSCWLLFFRS